MNRRIAPTLPIATVLLLAGCYASAEDVESGEATSALDLENGGLDMEDELPAFGVEEELAELDLLEGDPALEDPMATDAEVLSMTRAPEAVRYRVALTWGQIPGDRTQERPRDWSGLVVASRGAVLVDRTLRFEGRTDRLLPRRDRHVVPFTSATLPHHDGLLLTVVDPTPEASEPLTLTYVADLPGPFGAEAGHLTVPVRGLLDGPRELASDGRGNRMVAVAAGRPVDPCGHGFLMGRWDRVDDRHGRQIGRVVGADGSLRGHVRGIWGTRESGEQVFFGKHIDTGGRFRGIFRGHYADGHYEGRWITREGDAGAVGGRYRERVPGPEVGGHFIGRWAEATCDMRPRH